MSILKLYMKDHVTQQTGVIAAEKLRFYVVIFFYNISVFFTVFLIMRDFCFKKSL